MADWVSWTEDMTVHVEKIDDQHRELIKRFNQLGEAVWEGKGKEAVGDMIKFLAEYTVEHFSDEEELMRIYEYPKAESHRQAHKDFVKKVGDLINDLHAREFDSPLVISVVNKLGDWTRMHIRVMDKELGSYIRSKM
jgi:hemerythrin